MNRTLKTVLYEPPFRLVIKALLRNRLATSYLFNWAALFDALPYPAYAVGLQTAAKYTRLAGATGFSTIELGVAGGNGLLELSKYAAVVSRAMGLQIKVVGFDAGCGLPHNSDYRDAPWLWKSGDFPGDPGRLRKRLPASTDLILGPIEETFPRWLRDETVLPIGFVSVDVDYHSSTVAICEALGSAEVNRLLPFVSCYFDDVLRYLVPRSAGEMAAIMEFNRRQENRQFDRDDWLGEDRPYGHRLWLKRMYTLYCFDHPATQVCRRREASQLDLIRV